MNAETEQERGRRHHQRTLFDGVAELYADSRRGYPAELVDFVVTTAGLRAGSTVLEVGCGPGQLTEHLTRRGFDVTAIDIGPSMIAAARNRLAGSAISFQVTSFEDFAAAEASFDLICSGTAFHWVDPEVKFSKPARLLSWPADVRQSFTGELRHYLRSQPEVHLTQQTSLTMACVLPRPEHKYDPS